MFKPKQLLLLLPVLLLSIFNSLTLAEDQITITTYYPSPYGSYNYLQTDKLGVGDNSGDGFLSSDDVPTTTGDVWIKGKVGIGTGTAGPTATLQLNGTAKIFGARTSGYTDGTVYQAPSDGFVIGVNPSSTGATKGYTGGNNPPTTLIAADDQAIGGESIMFPVRKGEYWNVINGETSDLVIYWIPIGN